MVIYFAWQLHIDYYHVEGEFNSQLLKLEHQQNRGDSRENALNWDKKGGYFGVMIIASLFGARALWRLRTPFYKLSIVTAVLFLAISYFCCSSIPVHLVATVS